MKRNQLKASTIGLLLLPLVLALFACSTQTARSNNNATGDDKKPGADPPTVVFCDLVGNPNRYDGKVVRTEAIVAVGFEVGIVYDPKCGDREKRAWYDFDQSTYQPQEKGWQSLRSFLFPESKQGSGHYRGRARAIMVGRFNASAKAGYGHLNGYHFLFTIMHVEKAAAVPDDLPD